MKSLPKAVFAIYLLCLLWLVLFKTSLDFVSVLHIHMRTINLVPFTGRRSEMIENFILFIPFGLLLSATFKKVTFGQKLLVIFVSSVAIETIQYILAIGISDITDVTTNTLGGLCGLVIYTACNRSEDSEKLDRIVAVVIACLIVAILFLRFFVFRVRY